jgi:hypothetical protein
MNFMLDGTQDHNVLSPDHRQKSSRKQTEPEDEKVMDEDLPMPLI